jgi:hypothetical protein
MLLTPGLLRGLVPYGEPGFYGDESGSGDPVVVTKWVYRVVLSHAWVCALHLMCCVVGVHKLLIMMIRMNCVGICETYLCLYFCRYIII